MAYSIGTKMSVREPTFQLRLRNGRREMIYVERNWYRYSLPKRWVMRKWGKEREENRKSGLERNKNRKTYTVKKLYILVKESQPAITVSNEAWNRWRQRKRSGEKEREWACKTQRERKEKAKGSLKFGEREGRGIKGRNNTLWRRRKNKENQKS